MDVLLKIIESYLKNQITYSEFEQTFYQPYMDLELDLAENYELYFQEICEKLDFTSNRKLSADEIANGWITANQFKVWLRLNHFKFSSTAR